MEKTLHDDMLIHIVETILEHYSDCIMILFSLQYLENHEFNQDIIEAVTSRYKS